MAEPLIFIDVSEIAPGKLDATKAGFDELASFVADREPRVLAYHVFFSADETVVTVVQVHPDSASMELHMEVGAELFRRFTGLLRMKTMEIYGDPSPALLDAMRAKAAMLGAAEVAVHHFGAGFTRLAAPDDS